MKKIIYLLTVLSLVILPMHSLGAVEISVPMDSIIKNNHSTVYYYASDGYRYVFPNGKTYESWFENYSEVKEVSNEELANIPLRGNITYRPGFRMVKIQTDPKVYVVDAGGILRWVPSEEKARELYGDDWNKKIDDIPDVFFVNYTVGAPLSETISDYVPNTILTQMRTINRDKGLTENNNAPVSTTVVGGRTTPSGTITAVPAVPRGQSGTSTVPAIPAIPANGNDGPVISNILILDVTSNSARIYWETDGYGDSKVYYGMSTSTYGSIFGTTTHGTGTKYIHNVTLPNLSPATVYYFKVSSTDRSGKRTETSDGSFTTATEAEKSVTVVSPNGGEVWKLGETHDIKWSSVGLEGYEATISVFYGSSGFDLANNIPVSQGSWPWTIVTTEKSNPSGGVHIFSTGDNIKIRISVYVGEGIESIHDSSDNYFRIIEPQGVCADLTVTDIEFTPSDPQVGQSVSRVSKVLNQGTIASPVVNVKMYVDDELAGYGSFGPLQPGATVADYSHNVHWGGPWTATPGTHKFEWVIDADNHVLECNETNNSLIKYITTSSGGDITPPVISGILVTGLTSTTANIYWQADEESSGMLYYGLSPSSYTTVLADSTYVSASGTYNIATVSGLTQGTTYYYKVSSTDTSNNTSESSNRTFTTLNEELQPTEDPPSFLSKWNFEGSPTGITVDADGNVYMGDGVLNRIQKFTSTGTLIATWTYTRGSGSNQMHNVSHLTAGTDGNLYVVDSGNHRIQKLSNDGTFITNWGSWGANDGQFKNPTDIAVDSNNNVYVVDRNKYSVQKFTSDGTFITKWGSPGSGDGQFGSPYFITIDSNNNVFVSDDINKNIQKFTSNGTFIDSWGTPGTRNGEFSAINGLATNSNNSVYVLDRGANIERVQKFTNEGTFATVWGSLGSGDGEFFGIKDITIDNNNIIYILDYLNYRVQKFGSGS